MHARDDVNIAKLFRCLSQSAEEEEALLWESGEGDDFTFTSTTNIFSSADFGGMNVRIYGPRASRLGHKLMGQNADRNLQYGPRTRLVRGMYFRHHW